jgi:hypothetical protein
MSALFVVQGRNKKYGSINRDFWQRCYKLTGLAGWSIMRIDILGKADAGERSAGE